MTRSHVLIIKKHFRYTNTSVRGSIIRAEHIIHSVPLYFYVMYVIMSYPSNPQASHCYLVSVVCIYKNISCYTATMKRTFDLATLFNHPLPLLLVGICS